jgi:hypothetical protein
MQLLPTSSSATGSAAPSTSVGSSTSGAAPSSLRERRGVKFFVNTNFYDYIPILRKRAPARQPANRRRRENPTVVTTKPAQDIPVRCLEQFVPGLCAAFAADPRDAFTNKEKPTFRSKSVRTSQQEEFTHIISISTGITPGSIEQSVDQETGTNKLHLVVPISSADNGYTALTFSQLLAARDFLSLALPYSLTRPPPSPSLRQEIGVRSLITAPQCRPADALSIVVCYLAHASRERVDTVLTYINEDAEILSVWQGVISKDGMVFIEDVARERG